MAVETEKKKRSWQRRLEKSFKKFLVWTAKYTIPYLYLAYFRFVWATSKVVDETTFYLPLLDVINATGKFVNVLWHQDVMCVAWVFKRYSPHTIASVGDAGEIIAKLLKLCTFTVFRGGSSKGSARKHQILDEFVEHLQQVSKAVVGITVDGASGPPYRLKTGSIVMAVKTQIPVFVVRIWCKRKILLPTWDRTMIPLPFNSIRVFIEGPFMPPSTMEESKFASFHHFVEKQLLDLTYKSFLMLDKKLDPELMSRFPSDWTPPTFETDFGKKSQAETEKKQDR